MDVIKNPLTAKLIRPAGYLELIGGLLIFGLFWASFISMPVGGWADTKTYLWLRLNADGNPWVWGELRNIGPPFVPLFYFIFRDDGVATMLQAVLSLAAWFLAARAAARLISTTFLSELCFVVLFAGCLGGDVIIWNRILSTESFSISFLLLFLALMINIHNKYHGIKLILSAVFLTLSRVTWVYFIPIAILSLFVRRFHWRTAGLCGAILIIVFGINWYEAPFAAHTMPFQDNFFTRVINNPDAEAYFLGQGMPNLEVLRAECGGKFAYQCKPPPPEFDQWLLTTGESAYKKWLILTLHRQLFDFVLSIPSWDDGDFYAYNNTDSSRPLFDDFSRRLTPIGNRNPVYFFVVIGAIIAGLLFGQVHKARLIGDPAIQAAIIVLFALGANMFVCFLGDSSEIQRHMIAAFIGAQVMSLVIAFLMIDRLWLPRIG
jgi:hypothetical protein